MSTPSLYYRAARAKSFLNSLDDWHRLFHWGTDSAVRRTHSEIPTDATNPFSLVRFSHEFLRGVVLRFPVFPFAVFLMIAEKF